MKGLFCLVLVIVLEVFGSMMLKLLDGFIYLWFVFGVIVGIGVFFMFLSFFLKSFDLFIVYVIWLGVGMVLMVIVGFIVFKEVMIVKMMIGFVLVIIGVILLNCFKF